MSTRQKNKLKKAIISFLLAVIAIYFGIDEVKELDNHQVFADDMYQVVRVVDGDTLIIQIDGEQERVRLIGIDTPESVHPDQGKNVPYGEVASAYTKSLVEGKNVALELDAQERDQYGRVLAYVYVENKMLNKDLLEKGHATVATYPPNVKYVDEFIELEKIAKSKGIGLWEYK